MANSKFIRLTLIGFSEAEQETFESILAIADSRLDKPWNILTEDQEADFYLLSSALRFQFDTDPMLQNLPRAQCIFSVHNKTESADYELLVDRNNVPYLKGLVELFNQLSLAEIQNKSKQSASSDITKKMSANNLSSIQKEKKTELDIPTSNTHSEKPVERTSRGFFDKMARGFFVKTDNDKNTKNDTKPINAAATTDTFDPMNYPFIRYLLGKTNAIFCCSLQGVGDIYLDIAEKVYYSAEKLSKLQPYFTIQQDFSVKQLAQNELQKNVLEYRLKPQPINNLLWCSVFNCSQGRLVKGYDVNNIVHLKRWPDINLPGCQKLIKLAAYMHSNAVTLAMAQSHTGIPLEKVYDFYNACSLINLIELHEQSEIHEKSMDEEQRELYAKIGKRINLK